MKNRLALMLVLFLFSPAMADYPPAPEQLLPDFVAPLKFGTTHDEFDQLPDRAKWLKSETGDFRIVHSKSNPTPDIPWVTVYFDAEDTEPLYEFIIMYKTETAARDAGIALFGETNHDGEWRFTRNDGIEIQAWNHQNKLVVVAVLPDCEWDESQDL